jgi:hypothetical protein
LGENSNSNQSTVSSRVSLLFVTFLAFLASVFFFFRAQITLNSSFSSLSDSSKLQVSGQGIMAGVRTSTIRPTGMGGGAIPHDQITGENGEEDERETSLAYRLGNDEKENELEKPKEEDLFFNWKSCCQSTAQHQPVSVWWFLGGPLTRGSV